MDANMQLTINSFRRLFRDTSLTAAFADFPYKWSPCQLSANISSSITTSSHLWRSTAQSATVTTTVINCGWHKHNVQLATCAMWFNGQKDHSTCDCGTALSCMSANFNKVQETAVAGLITRWHQKSMEAQVVNSHLVWDPTIQQPGFDLPRQQEQGHWGACRRKWRLTDTVSLWRDPDDVSHCRILSPDKTEWQIISATLCGWRCCFVADQLWFMTCIQEEKEQSWESQNNLPKPYIV